MTTVGNCEYCGLECNYQSQACGSCMRNETMLSLGSKPQSGPVRRKRKRRSSVCPWKRVKPKRVRLEERAMTPEEIEKNREEIEKYLGKLPEKANVVEHRRLSKKDLQKAYEELMQIAPEGVSFNKTLVDKRARKLMTGE